MSRVVCLLALLLVLWMAWPAGPAHAGDAAGYAPTADEVRRAASARPYYESRRRPKERPFRAYVPLWIPGVSGSFAEGDVSVEPERDTSDLLDKFFDIATSLDFAFVGAFSYQHGPWSFTVEGFGARLGNEITFTLTDGRLVDVNLGMFIAAGWVGHRVVTKPFCMLGKRSCVKVDAFAGARWYHVSADVKLPGEEDPLIDVAKNWVDPIVGLDGHLDFGPRWVLRVKADVGGFGVGSELAWWLSATLEYRLSNLFSMSAGWAVMDADYDTGSGDDEFKWNLTLSGPMVILGFRF